MASKSFARLPSTEYAPEIDIRGDLFHFTHQTGTADGFALGPAACRELHRCLTEAIVWFDTRPSAKIYNIEDGAARH